MKLSKEKLDKISEQILSFLYSSSPRPLFTSHIAREIARDEEFIKKILINLKKKKLIVDIKKNSKGDNYLRRCRWKMNESTYLVYKRQQDLINQK